MNCEKCKRLKRQMAIQAEQIKLANERGDYWKDACIREMNLAFSLTKAGTSLKVHGTSDKGGISLPVKEER